MYHIIRLPLFTRSMVQNWICLFFLVPNKPFFRYNHARTYAESCIGLKKLLFLLILWVFDIMFPISFYKHECKKKNNQLFKKNHMILKKTHLISGMIFFHYHYHFYHYQSYLRRLILWTIAFWFTVTFTYIASCNDGYI